MSDGRRWKALDDRLADMKPWIGIAVGACGVILVICGAVVFATAGGDAVTGLQIAGGSMTIIGLASALLGVLLWRQARTRPPAA